MPACLYVLQAIAPTGVPYGPLKIGETSNLPRRLGELRPLLPVGHDVQAVLVIPASKAGAQLLESRLAPSKRAA